MFITRQNPKGGRRLRDNSFPIDEDPQTHQFGYKVGYCEGCGEPLLMKLSDAELLANKFGYSLQDYKQKFKSIKPREPLRLRMAKWLMGSMPERRDLQEREEDGY